MHIATAAAVLSFFLAPAGAGILAQQAEPRLTRPPTLPPELRRELEQRFAAAYDEANAGWSRGEKRLDPEAVELSLVRAYQGAETARDRARATLDAATKLIDPASGGIARSSSASNWRAPVPERTLAAQADALRAYALAFALWRFPQDEQIARGVVRYLDRSLASPTGAFLADRGAARRVPARENGAVIEGLAALADATGDVEALARARRAARFVLAHRGTPGGGFRGGEGQGPAALADTLAMGAAFLALYGATAEPEWLDHAGDAAQALEGFPAGTVAESAGLARFANLLSQWTGEERHRALAFRALRMLQAAAAEPEGPPQPALLLAADELSRPPLHITVAGRFDDPAARALYAAARRIPFRYKRTDLWDRTAGPLRNTAVQFPPVKAAAAFICSETSCSLPIKDPADLAQAADRAAHRGAGQP
jgi:uncharacterized protein YyaL (SSP411 family)